MPIDFSTINNGTYSDSVSLDSHVPPMNWGDGSTFDNGQDYQYFGSPILSSNKTLTNGEDLKNRMVDSKVLKAEKLGLRGKAFSDFIELDILPSSVSSRDTQISSLVPLADDKQIEKPSVPINGTSLIDVIKQSCDNQNEILSSTLDAFNHMTTLLHNQNEIIKQANEIALESNRLALVDDNRNGALHKVIVESLTSIGQSLEYIPTMIETMSIGNEKQADLINTQNSHLFQKNVNDAYAFNYDKDDEKGTKRSLDAISNHLSRTANSHDEIKVHQEKQAKQAENESKDWDDENSSFFGDLLDFASDFYDGAKDAIDSELSDIDIFTQFIEQTSIKEKDIKDGYNIK